MIPQLRFADLVWAAPISIGSPRDLFRPAGTLVIKIRASNLIFEAIP
jgi:hypothetical protein